MTQEEIIKEYEGAVVANGLAAAAGNEEAAKSYELFKAGLSALTPPTQEQMERVWPGCGHCTDPDTAEAWGRWEHQYCHYCGRPLTPEAWEELKKRWEALKDGKAD